jgi:Ser/Thr protein kinase RdoA (MazF antagonist)
LEAFGKVYRDERWQAGHDLLVATSTASAESQGAWRAARPLAVVPRWRLVVQEALPGRRFRDLLADLTRDDATDPELALAERHLARVARAVRAMQRAPIASGPRLDFETLLATQERNLEYLRDSYPVIAGDLTALRAEIRRLAPALPALPLGFAHGDFAHGNVLIDGERVGIIDFDRAGQAEPVYDVAYFLTHLISFALRHPRRRVHLARLCDSFRATYLALAPEVSAGRLALYESLDLSAYVLRNFRKQSHQAKWIRWVEGQIDAAWERLPRAGGREGGAQ